MSLSQEDYDFGPESNYDLANLITTSSNKARKLWARAYCFMINYNHEEAAAVYQECLEEDPECAMAWWGISYCLSPTYNFPPGLGCGYDPIQQAVNLLQNKTQLEKDLVHALAKRHSKEARDKADPASLEMGNDPALAQPYCDAMKSVYEKYTDNPDVIALYLEGLMNLKPWALWERDVDSGVITPADDNTLVIVKVLDEAFAKFGYTHPALCHICVHTYELSPYPERALPAANALRTIMPDGGHLSHMASHIDSWVGQWKEAIDANIAGVAADEKYVRQSGKDAQFYKLYRMHNYHFIVWSAMFEGRYELALDTARRVEKWFPAGQNGVEMVLGGVIPMGLLLLEAYLGLKWHVMIRFGKWDEILAEPTLEDANLYAGTIAIQHYARGVAYASKGLVAKAEMERDLFYKALENPALKERCMSNNVIWQDPKDGPSLLAVSRAVLEGEIEYRKQYLAKKAGEPYDFTKAFDYIRQGVRLDLGLKYDEPWGQMQPVRHVLGALLLEQGHVEEAEQAYRADIAHYKDNMWGLLGLKLCLESKLANGSNATDKDATEAELAKVSTLFKERSARADIVPDRTCFCAKASNKQQKKKGQSCCMSQ